MCLVHSNIFGVPWMVLFFHLIQFRLIMSIQSLKMLVGFFFSCLMSPLSQPSLLQNKRHKQNALWYISVFEVLWFIIQLPFEMVQLGSNFCWGLAAAVSNRQLNIYILLRSSKQTLFWGSAVWAVKLFYLCTCLHYLYIFMLNECKFCLNHGPAQGSSGGIMRRRKVQGDKSNSLFLFT